MPTRESILQSLRHVEDPEIGINIVDLGLIYDIDISDNGNVGITMTLTSPMCPIGPEIVSQVEKAVGKLDDIKKVKVTIAWDPPWNPAEMASEEVKDRLGIW